MLPFDGLAAEAEADRPLVLSGLLEEVIGAPLRIPIIHHEAKPCLGTAPFLARPDGDLPEPEPARRMESQRGCLTRPPVSRIIFLPPMKYLEDLLPLPY